MRDPIMTEFVDARHSHQEHEEERKIFQSLYNKKGDSYAGSWLNHKKHGKGTYIWKGTGLVYEGDWANDKRNGKGTLSLRDAHGSYRKIYTGGWMNDLRHCYGTQYYSEGEYYEGDWYAGKRSGRGRMFYADGTIYEGEWYSDQRSGQGMLRMNNEHRYEGAWKDDKKHGAGKYYYLQTGQLYEGVWKEDLPVCGTMRDFGRDTASVPTQFPIPPTNLADPSGVLETAVASLYPRAQTKGKLS